MARESGEGQCLAGDRQLLVGRVDDEGDGRVGSGHDARLLDAALVGLDVDLDAEGGEGLGQLAAHVVVVLADAGGEGDDVQATELSGVGTHVLQQAIDIHVHGGTGALLGRGMDLR